MKRSLDLITTKEAAEVLDCTVQHVRLLIRTGKLDGSKIGRDWFADRLNLGSYALTRYKRPEAPEQLVVRDHQRTLFEDPELQAIVNVASVPQRSPFRYPGGKTWLIPVARMWLESLKPKPSLLVEPFAGGGGIALMAAFESRAERSLLVELDPDVSAVWEAILGRTSGLLRQRILSFVCTESEVKKALASSPTSNLKRAFQTILRNRVSRGGILAPGAGLVKQGEANKGIASRWYPETLAKRINAIYEQRSRIFFRNGDGMNAIKEHSEDPGTAFFIDPPYPIAGKRLYTYFDLNHRRLFELMSEVKGPFLATYDQNPEIRALADQFGLSWKLIPMKSTHHAKKFELLISRDLNWLDSEEALTACADVLPVSA